VSVHTEHDCKRGLTAFAKNGLNKIN